MAVRITLASFAGEGAAPDYVDAGDYPNPAAAVAAIVSGFLPVNTPVDTTRKIQQIAAAQIRTIAQL